MDKQKIERRSASTAASSERGLEGYVVVYNAETVVGNAVAEYRGFREIILPGAFRGVNDADAPDTVALLEHNIERPLGRRKNGTLRLAEDERGVKVEIDLPDTSYARDIAALVKRRDMEGMSVGMVVDEDEWDFSADVPLRTIKRARALDVTVCLFPVYPDTEVALRSMQIARDSVDNSKVAAAKAERERQLELLRIKR